jgi:peptide/nickel transport system substrate-binding protein
VTGRGQRPRRWRWPVGSLLALALLASACGSAAGGGTTVTYVGVAGGTISFGMTGTPTGCNPNMQSGSSVATRTILGAVLPSTYVVSGAGAPQQNSDLVLSSELVNLKPQTVVYTLDPKAVWSDGVPITAADFVYAWQAQRDQPVVSSSEVSSIQGYKDIASVIGSNGGHTVTVKFKTTFADWQSLFDNLMPAHIMEKVGWDPPCPMLNSAIDLSGGPFEIGSVTPQTVTLVQNPRWWGTPANARSIVVHLASSTSQLTQWMTSGYVQVAQPSTVTQSFLTQTTGLPGAQSDVDTSGTQLQLDMASSLNADLSPDLRFAIALLINRQDLVNQLASWAVPGLTVADSHVAVQGQPNYTPPPNAASTTTVPPSTSSTSTTVIGGGGSINFPVTPVPDQAAAFIGASGLTRAGSQFYHYAFGAPFQLHMVYDASDPWAAAAAPIMREELEAAGLDTTLAPVTGASQTGQVLADGFADLAVLPVNFSPYLSQTLAWYTTLLGPPGKNGSEDWTNFSDPQFDKLVQTGSQQLNAKTSADYYAQADTVLWKEMVSLPLFPEPAALAWSRRIGGVTPAPRSTSLLWYAQLWAVRRAEATNNTTPTLPGQ